jgi:hypothetical protein
VFETDRATLLTRSFALAAAVFIAFIGAYWNVQGGGLIYSVIDTYIGAGASGSNLNTDEQLSYELLASFYVIFFCPFVGLAIVLLFWNKGFSPTKEKILAAFLLLIALPAFSMNIIAHDRLIRLWVQAALDILVAICSLYFVLVLVQQKFDSLLATIAKFAVVALLTIFFVFVPTFYAMIWTLVQMGMSGHLRRYHQDQTIEYIIVALSLLAFLAVLGLYAYCSRLKAQQELVKSAVEEDRLQTIEIIAKRFSVDTEGLTQTQKGDIIIRQIEMRSRREMMIGISFVVTAMLVRIIVVLNY